MGVCFVCVSCSCQATCPTSDSSYFSAERSAGLELLTDPSSGPGHDLSRSKSRWPLRLFHRWLQILRQWTERRPPVRELESDMSLSLAFFNCRATPVVISTADLQAEEDLSLKSGKSGAGFKQVARGAPFGAELEKAGAETAPAKFRAIRGRACFGRFRTPINSSCAPKKDPFPDTTQPVS